MRKPALPLAMAALLLASCATQTGPVGEAMSQPLRDLSLVREETPDVLSRAAAKPYDQLFDCAGVTEELAALEEALGPDLDAPPTEDGMVAGEMLAEVIDDVLALPFRGIVRRITGAHQRDREKARAIVAGVGRRGFLRGLAQERGCGLSGQQPAPSGEPS